MERFGDVCGVDRDVRELSGVEGGGEGGYYISVSPGFLACLDALLRVERSHNCILGPPLVSTAYAPHSNFMSKVSLGIRPFRDFLTGRHKQQSINVAATIDSGHAWQTLRIVGPARRSCVSRRVVSEPCSLEHRVRRKQGPATKEKSKEGFVRLTET